MYPGRVKWERSGSHGLSAWGCVLPAPTRVAEVTNRNKAYDALCTSKASSDQFVHHHTQTLKAKDGSALTLPAALTVTTTLGARRDQAEKKSPPARRCARVLILTALVHFRRARGAC